MNTSPANIVRMLILLLAVVAAFVAVPYGAELLVVLGVVLGVIGVSEERRMMLLIMAVALGSTKGALATLPGVGEVLTGILGNVSIGLNGAALAVICSIIVDRVRNG